MKLCAALHAVPSWRCADFTTLVQRSALQTFTLQDKLEKNMHGLEYAFFVQHKSTQEFMLAHRKFLMVDCISRYCWKPCSLKHCPNCFYLLFFDNCFYPSYLWVLLWTWIFVRSPWTPHELLVIPTYFYFSLKNTFSSVWFDILSTKKTLLSRSS